jgi:hypothetical protein
MALPIGMIPYGLRQVMIAPLGAVDLIGTKVAFPNARTFSFTDGTDSVELRGDDKQVANRDTGTAVEWELESGGISFEAWKTLGGGTVVETGTTPNQIKTFKKLGADTRGYVYIEGRAINDGGGDFHCKLPKAKATGDMTGELSDQNFWLTGASGVAIASTSVADPDLIYQFTQNETAVTIT